MDILFFAALAFYIFLKLNKNLGKIDDEEKKMIEKKIAEKKHQLFEFQKKFQEPQAKDQQQMKVVDPIPVKAEESSFILADENSNNALQEILKKSNIAATFFINGAKSSFEMIIKAFAAGDLKVLKFLLSQNIYEGFESAINNRKEQEKTLTTNLISIEKTEIISASLNENIALIAVKIVSKQINYISDKDQKVIEGRKDEIVEIHDVWTFRKDLNAQDPNWVVVVTAK